MSDIRIKKDAVLPKTRVRLVRGLRELDPIDLTGATSVLLKLTDSLGAPFSDVTCNVLNAIDGLVEIDWQASHTATVATYTGSFVITRAAGEEVVPDEGCQTVRVEARC